LFIHKEHVENFVGQCIKKSPDRKTSESDFAHFADYIKQAGYGPTTTPFEDAQ
jgi:hypothetical protein